MTETTDNGGHPAPEWLTIEYLENVLQKHKKDDNLKILMLDVKPATSKGENYASVMSRVNVTIKSDKVYNETFIVKTSYESDEFVANIMGPYDLYKTEMVMYDKILPQLTEILRESGDEEKLFADTIYVDYAHSAIIFEDLCVSNFAVANRLEGMDMNHAKIALKKLAKMHAASAKLKERSPGVLEKFDHGIFNRYTQGFLPFFQNMFEVCANYARDCDELGEYYAKKILALKPLLGEYVNRVYDPCDQFFNTLNHGDFWINNIMLRYSDDSDVNSKKSILDILLIDFQFCTWGSPAVDLHYFFNTSLTCNLRLNHQEELVQYYHQVLTNTLHDLNYTGKVPTLHDFWIQLEAGRFYAVTSTLVVQPVMINDKTEDADFQALIMDDERGKSFRKLLYSNKIVQKYVKILLPIFDRRGLLDVRD